MKDDCKDEAGCKDDTTDRPKNKQMSFSGICETAHS